MDVDRYTDKLQTGSQIKIMGGCVYERKNFTGQWMEIPLWRN